jgi:dsDNA-specific endonuclease/ATPase MutS2
MKSMNTEINKVVSKVKEAQGQLQNLINSHDWVEEARKYAERQGKEVKKILTSDVSKVKSFLEKERKELERFQKQIPGEVKKLRKFVNTQKKEFEKLLANVVKMNNSSGKKKVKQVKAKVKKATTSVKKKKPASAAASS